jgi:hypothetical protein
MPRDGTRKFPVSRKKTPMVKGLSPGRGGSAIRSVGLIAEAWLRAQAEHRSGYFPALVGVFPNGSADEATA